MVTQTGWLYLGAGTLLFFFWAYGIVSFALDLKHKILPGVKGWLAERREQKQEEEKEREREERKQQLY
ncbi:hypothetical protein [Halomicrococcus sp. SG-WS-1]|uniref:hypothetical protein n=1 Tax=Halomicrococcus sp. SG-WS-1 TaxID=3439057 RepID=UPI003F79E680